MACRFIGCNRSVLHCELQQKQILVIRTSDGKELKLLCVWFPQTRGDAYELDEVTASLREKADNVLIGYGQAPGNPMFCYCLQAKKISKKIKKESGKNIRFLYRYVIIGSDTRLFHLKEKK